MQRIHSIKYSYVNYPNNKYKIEPNFLSIHFIKWHCVLREMSAGAVSGTLAIHFFLNSSDIHVSC